MIVRQPVTLERLDWGAQPVDEGGGCIAAFKSSSVHKRLERRAGLPPALRGAVERALIEASAAHQSSHLPGGWVESNQCALKGLVAQANATNPPLPRLDSSHSAQNLGLGGPLKAGIDCRVHLKATFVHTLCAELLHQLLSNFLLEVLAIGFLSTQAILKIQLTSIR